MYINDLLAESAQLQYGDYIFVLGLKISFINNILYINNPNRLLKYDGNLFSNRTKPKLNLAEIGSEQELNIELYKKKIIS